MVIAGMMGVIFPTTSPILIALEVALGSTVAKTAHYYVAFWARGRLGEEKRLQLERIGNRVWKWASVVLFVAAVTPVPDEPVVIPLGLMRYSPKKFFLVFFTGKTIIALAGAVAGQSLGSALLAYFSGPMVIVLAAVFTVVITVIMVKVDLGRFLRRLGLQRGVP